MQPNCRTMDFVHTNHRRKVKNYTYAQECVQTLHRKVCDSFENIMKAAECN